MKEKVMSRRLLNERFWGTSADVCQQIQPYTLFVSCVKSYYVLHWILCAYMVFKQTVWHSGVSPLQYITVWAFLAASTADILPCGHDNLKAIPITGLVTFYRDGCDFMTSHFPFTILVIDALSCYVTSSAMCNIVLLLWKLTALGSWIHFIVWHMESFLVNIHFFAFSNRLYSALKIVVF